MRGVSRVGKQATCTPDILAAVLDETLPPEVTLFELAAGTPVLWKELTTRLTKSCRPMKTRHG